MKYGPCQCYYWGALASQNPWEYLQVLPSTQCTCRREGVLWKTVSGCGWLGTDALSCSFMQMAITNSIILPFCFIVFFLCCKSASSEYALNFQSSSWRGPQLSSWPWAGITESLLIRAVWQDLFIPWIVAYTVVCYWKIFFYQRYIYMLKT